MAPCRVSFCTSSHNGFCLLPADVFANFSAAFRLISNSWPAHAAFLRLFGGSGGSVFCGAIPGGSDGPSCALLFRVSATFVLLTAIPGGSDGPTTCFEALVESFVIGLTGREGPNFLFEACFDPEIKPCDM